MQYALYTRHRISRLLVATRWVKTHGAMLDNTVIAENVATNHAQIFEDVAEQLWRLHHIAADTTAPRPAVSSAVDVLTAGSLTTLPRVVQSAIGINPPVDTPEKRPLLTSDISEVTQELTPSATADPAAVHHHKAHSKPLGVISPSVTERLGIATRNCIRESLLHLGGLQIFSWRSGIADVCVKIGTDKFWTADVSLDSLDPDTAVLRVHAISILIRNDTDAAEQTESHQIASADKEHHPSHMSSSQDALLRRMADDRMSAAIHAALAFAKDHSTINRTCIMLCALRDMMMDDVCAPLAMDYLRAQAAALSNERWNTFLRVDGASPDTARDVPLTIHYWLQHRQPASLRITEFRSSAPTATNDVAPTKSDRSDRSESSTEAALERKPTCITCVHDPPLPNAVELGGVCSMFELQMNNLNLEDLLGACIKLRTRARLKALSDTFRRNRVKLRINPSCIVFSRPQRPCGESEVQRAALVEDVLLLHLGADGETGVEIRILAMTGGIRIRPYGSAALSIPVQRNKNADLWRGARHLNSSTEETEAAIAAFEAIRARVKLSASARSVCALDIGVSNTLPPGTASVAATASPERAASQLVPPFAPLERRAPRRFLTLSPPPPEKDLLSSLQSGGILHGYSRTRSSGSRGLERSGRSKRPRLTYATTSDALVFIQESSFAGEDWYVGNRPERSRAKGDLGQTAENDCVDRYSGTAAAAAAWAVTRDVVGRRLRRDSLIRAFVAANVASAAQMHHLKSSEDGDLHLESASRVLLKVKCEPLPVRRAELLLRGNDAWQVRLSLLPPIFDSTDSLKSSCGKRHERDVDNSTAGDGNLWSVGVACSGSQLTFTYPSANAASVRSFFRDLTRARTAAALARGVPPSPFYRVLRRSPVRIVVGIGPYSNGVDRNGEQSAQQKPLYTATVEYVYSKGNSGGFSLSFSPSKPTMEQLAPLIEEALDASGGQVGGILAGLLERACPVAAAAESAVRERGNGRIRFVTALRVRAVFAGVQRSSTRENSQNSMMPGGQGPARQAAPTSQIVHAVDVDARGGSGLVTVIDVGRATAVMIQQGFANRGSSSGGGSSSRGRSDFVPLPKWDGIVGALNKDGYAEAQRAGSTVVLKMEVLEKFLSDLVSSAGVPQMT